MTWPPGDVGLVSLDVGYTLGEPAGPTITQRLVALSPLPAVQAKSMVQQHLHTARPDDSAAVARACTALRIDPTVFPHDHRPPPFLWWPGAVGAVAALARAVPVVTMSNVTSWDERPSDVTARLAPHLTAHYPSWRLGFAKPDPQALRAVAMRHQIPAERLVHVGDSFDYDVRGALAAGARAVWITREPAPVVRLPAADRQRVVTVPDLRAAIGFLLTATTSSRTSRSRT
ncbi:HAD hydrolase-like protein [Streptomyces sp. NPDC000405]|uniref:HAD hydrolase-like protein n=1 Tax=Streptomyces sp. NPDC000405 TaxID=3161033 RepID=UPI00398C9FA5